MNNYLDIINENTDDKDNGENSNTSTPIIRYNRTNYVNNDVDADDNFNQDEFETISNEIHRRFPDANFSICCFDDIDEIDTKVVVENIDEPILIRIDYFYTREEDFFLVFPNEERKVLYKDVINGLIFNDLDLTDDDHHFLELISQIPNKNNNSLLSYTVFFGS